MCEPWPRHPPRLPAQPCRRVSPVFHRRDLRCQWCRHRCGLPREIGCLPPSLARPPRWRRRSPRWATPERPRDPSSTRCCNRRRRGLRTPSCPVRRSGATRAIRRCTTRPPQSSSCARAANLRRRFRGLGRRCCTPRAQERSPAPARPRRARRPRQPCAPPAPSDEARSGRGRRESSCWWESPASSSVCRPAMPAHRRPIRRGRWSSERAETARCPSLWEQASRRSPPRASASSRAEGRAAGRAPRSLSRATSPAPCRSDWAARGPRAAPSPGGDWYRAWSCRGGRSARESGPRSTRPHRAAFRARAPPPHGSGRLRWVPDRQWWRRRRPTPARSRRLAPARRRRRRRRPSAGRRNRSCWVARWWTANSCRGETASTSRCRPPGCRLS